MAIRFLTRFVKIALLFRRSVAEHPLEDLLLKDVAATAAVMWAQTSSTSSSNWARMSLIREGEMRRGEQ